VLVEVPVQVNKLAIALNSGGNVVKEVSNSQVPALRPTVFAFDGLSPGTKYTLTVTADGKPIKNCDPSSPAGFKTMSHSGQCRIGVVSCNKIYVSLKSNGETAWDLLKQRVLAGDLDCLLHVGDQVYADHEYGDFKDAGKETKLDEQKFLEKVKKEGAECIFLNAKMYLESLGGYEQWSSGEETVREMFRALYRQTWSLPSTAAVLANVPNTMVPDDHEFRDDWGDRCAHRLRTRVLVFFELKDVHWGARAEDFDRRGVAWFVARCGYRVFREYQAALSQGGKRPAANTSRAIVQKRLSNSVNAVV
jgi:hypothetical protein